uniref:MARVEL domain-containing protein n=1 Tax=Strongyloides papillosus TaxID=174720 RepID=A0A0N5BUC3_STREA
MAVSITNIIDGKEYVDSYDKSHIINPSHEWNDSNFASSTHNNKLLSLLSVENTFSISRRSKIKPIVNSSIPTTPTTTKPSTLDKNCQTSYLYHQNNIPTISVLKESTNIVKNSDITPSSYVKTNSILPKTYNISQVEKSHQQHLNINNLSKKINIKKECNTSPLQIFNTKINNCKTFFNDYTLFGTTLTTAPKTSSTSTPTIDISQKDKTFSNLNNTTTTLNVNKNNNNIDGSSLNINIGSKNKENISEEGNSKLLIPLQNAPHIVVSEEALREEVYTPNFLSALWEMCFCCCCEPYRFVIAMTAFETFFSIYWFLNQLGIILKDYSHSETINIVILVLLTGLVIMQVIGLATTICAKIKGEARFLYPRIIIQTAFCCISMLSFLILLLYFTGRSDSINRWLSSKYMNMIDEEMDTKSRQEFESDLRVYITVTFVCSAISVVYYFFGLNMTMKWKRSLLEQAAARAYALPSDTGGYIPVSQEPTAPPPPTNPNFNE